MVVLKAQRKQRLVTLQGHVGSNHGRGLWRPAYYPLYDAPLDTIPELVENRTPSQQICNPSARPARELTGGAKTR